MRKPVAMATMLVVMVIYIGIAATIGTRLTDAPRLVQLIYYVVAGVAWVFPLKPVLNWMNEES